MVALLCVGVGVGVGADMLFVWELRRVDVGVWVDFSATTNSAQECLVWCGKEPGRVECQSTRECVLDS